MHSAAFFLLLTDGHYGLGANSDGDASGRMSERELGAAAVGASSYVGGMGKKTLDQHIAVFGESGSGKTVLLSSFYGMMRERDTYRRTRLDVVADDAGQGDRLMSAYLGMRKEGRVPPTNRFSALPYSFTANFEHRSRAVKKAQGFDALRFIWHDYPGEWFHDSPGTPEEEQARSETFAKLLASDVALVLVDGEQLAANAGEEERYLRLLFTNIRNGLLPVIESAESGKPLKRFPRIWMFALSKADVLPEMTADTFRELVILKAAHEVDQFREALQRAVSGQAAIAVGEDFVLLSSAKFKPKTIDVDTRVGVDLIMPIASMLPVERFVRWARNKTVTAKVAHHLLSTTGAVAGVIAVILEVALSKLSPIGKAAGIAAFITRIVSKEHLDAIIKWADGKLEESLEEAVAKGDFLRATLVRFRLDLDDAEDRGVLVRSRR